jgi:selenocysteine lyase/cysteine desulfurase
MAALPCSADSESPRAARASAYVYSTIDDIDRLADALVAGV